MLITANQMFSVEPCAHNFCGNANYNIVNDCHRSGFISPEGRKMQICLSVNHHYFYTYLDFLRFADDNIPVSSPLSHPLM